MHSDQLIHVAFAPNQLPKKFSIARFEELFEIAYFPKLEFADWEVERYVKHKCAKAHQKGSIGHLALWLGQLHHKELAQPSVPNFTIQWIDATIGYGLFTNQALKKWEYVGEYTGILRRRCLFFPNINDYCFMYPREWISLKAFTIDSQSQGNYTRFINHSDTPNCESVAVLHDGFFHILFRAIDDIPAGSQLTYDYGDVYWHRRKKIQNSSE